MNTYLESKSITQLTIDARQRQSAAGSSIALALNILDKNDPNTWTLCQGHVPIARFNIVFDRSKPTSCASLSIKLVCQHEELRFANADNTVVRQVFAGVLFFSANKTIAAMSAFNSMIEADGSLNFCIRNSDFWAHKPLDKYLDNDGQVMGFRFVILDSDNRHYFSNDPVIIARDWMR